MSEEIKEKKCKSCGRVLPIGDFHKASHSKDGYYYRCKECKNNRIRCKYIYEMNKDSRECIKCRKIKPLEDFSKSTNKKNGRVSVCKECRRVKVSAFKFYIVSERGRVCTCCGLWKVWGEFHKSHKYKTGHVLFHKSHKYKTGHVYACKTCVSHRQKEFRQKTGRDDAQKHKTREYEKNRKKKDPAYRILCSCRTRIKNALKYVNGKKFYRTHELLGCAPEYFVQYLENNKYGYKVKDVSRYGLNVDHYIPVNHFDVTNKLQQLICFNYLNQQLLPSKENRGKWDYVPHDWEEVYEKIKAEVLGVHPELIEEVWYG